MKAQTNIKRRPGRKPLRVRKHIYLDSRTLAWLDKESMASGHSYGELIEWLLQEVEKCQNTHPED